MGIFRKFGVAIRGRALLLFIAGLAGTGGAAGQENLPPPNQTSVRLEADQQRKEGDLYFADGRVEVQYKNLQLRADHVQYNTKTYVAAAHGNVHLDVDTQHLTAESGEFNIRTGEGRFEHVHGEVRVQRKANAYVLVSPNPLAFEASEVRRIDPRTYTMDHAWVTVCEPDKPLWQFFTTHATLQVDRSVAMVNANFRMFRIPLLYLPYATAPAGRNLRQSGFLLPEIADTSSKGVVLGDGYYWAPRSWTDLSLGGAYLSRRGWQQNVEFRAKPWENVDILAKYFGVIDHGIYESVLNSSGMAVTELVKQGGHSAQVKLDALLGGGWRAAADYHELSSLTFQLAFAPTFGEAVNSEVRSTAFLTNNFRGFSVNFAGNSIENFLNAQPQVSVNLRSAPEANFASVDQSPWRRLPFYFGVDAFAGAVHRSDENLVTDPVTGVQSVVPGIQTDAVVERSEIAPRVVVPLHWGPWLGVTTSYAVRTTSYGAQIIGGAVAEVPLGRATGELNIDLQPATLERVWGNEGSKWKHTIEPEIEYNYVRGVNQFGHFIRFDDDETLTDTNEFLYSITQRLFHRSGEGQANELVSWRVAQKYYFDPTFNGALVPGTRNVFQALDSVTPFAFADEPRHFSPIHSNLQITPGGMYDAEVQLDYDTVRERISTAATLLKIKPTQNFNFALAHFFIHNATDLQPFANQIQARVAYGELNRRGLNVAVGGGYDFEQHVSQSQLIQVSYNGKCCGIALEYQRLALGPIRTENQFRVALIIANIGTFGNLRRQANIF
jgi:LPS-assembly protein